MVEWTPRDELTLFAHTQGYRLRCILGSISFPRTRQCQLTVLVLKDFHPFYLSLVFLGQVLH